MEVRPLLAQTVKRDLGQVLSESQGRDSLNVARNIYCADSLSAANLDFTSDDLRTPLNRLCENLAICADL